MNLRRRSLGASAVWPALFWTSALQAQPNATLAPVVIGWLSISNPNPGPDGQRAAFIEGMAELGWQIGSQTGSQTGSQKGSPTLTQYVLEERYAQGVAERLPGLALELAAKKPALIVALVPSCARAATAAAPTTPIVMANGDALAAGLVSSLAKPGGMITGVSNVSAATNWKVVELLVDAMPKLRRIAFIADSTIAAHAANVANAHRVAKHFGLEAVIAEVAKPEDLGPAFVQLVRAKVQAVVLPGFAWMLPVHIARIIEFALAQRWPVVANSSGIAHRGGLLYFGPQFRPLARRAAYYADRILKGTKPGDLPIEQPTTFEFILNLKTAKQLGITIPSLMRLRATEVIE